RASGASGGVRTAGELGRHQRHRRGLADVARRGTGVGSPGGAPPRLPVLWRTGLGGDVDRLLRVDLVLYPGFSGGPLVDAGGAVVGLVTSGLSRQLELAVPASTVSRVLSVRAP